MANKKFKAPFQFCKLDRAVRLLNKCSSFNVEVEDLLNFAINQHIVIHAYNSASPVCNLNLSAKDFSVLKSYFQFNTIGSYTYFTIEAEPRRRDFAVANDCAEFEGIPGLEESVGEVNAYITGYWPLPSWVVEKLYFNCAASLKQVSYPIGGLLHLDLFNHYINVYQTLDVDSLIIFSDELEKVYNHLVGEKTFTASSSSNQIPLTEREAEVISLEKNSIERATLPTSALITALLEIIYQPNSEIFDQSQRLHQDLQHKLAKLGSEHVTLVGGERSFSNLMIKVRQQLAKLRS